MSKRSPGRTPESVTTPAAPKQRDSVEQLLARVLDAPQLARAVPYLAPETLHQLIRHHGLEASGELVAAVTPAQLTSILDLDLWRNDRPGLDEQFDGARFGEWLEMLAESGPEVTARMVAAMDPRLVVAGLSRHIRVFDHGVFEPTVTQDDEALEFAPDPSGGLEFDISGYRVRATSGDAWDAIVALLTTLDSDAPASFRAVMQGCRALSNSTPEVDGLDDLLLAPEQATHDLAVGREARRSKQGYSTPAQAQAFLQLARQRIARDSTLNPVAAAYFRSVDEPTDDESAGDADIEVTTSPEFLEPEFSGGVMEVVALCAEAGLVPGQPRALLGSGSPGPSSDLAVIRRLMDYLRAHDERAYLARGRELAFLANTLVAGCSIQSRAFTAEEASDAAAAVCNLALEQQSAPDAFLADHDLIGAFEAGWATLYEQVSLPFADRLLAVITGLQSPDVEVRNGLRRLRLELRKQRAAGTPWQVRDALDAIAIIDLTTWTALLGLANECPVIPEALTAILDRRTTAVSPSAFEFISTRRQVEQVSVFLGRLEEWLSA